MRLIFVFSLIFLSLYLPAQKGIDSLQLKTANGHPMQYFVSLPDGSNKQKQWPIVVIIESADKEYKENALRFVRARKNMPFILVAPYNVNNSQYMEEGIRKYLLTANRYGTLLTM